MKWSSIPEHVGRYLFSDTTGRILHLRVLALSKPDDEADPLLVYAEYARQSGPRPSDPGGDVRCFTARDGNHGLWLGPLENDNDASIAAMVEQMKTILEAERERAGEQLREIVRPES